MRRCAAQRMRQQYHSFFLGTAFLLWAGLLMPAMLMAAPDITARYAQSQGTRLVIEINVGASQPASVILVQHLPPGVRILSSQPEAEQYGENRGGAKWLLRNLRPGTSTVTMTLDRAVSGADISAEIRFKSAQGGKMTTIQVEK